MLDSEPTGADSGATDTTTTSAPPAEATPRRRRAASRPAGPPAPVTDSAPPAKKTTKRTTKKAAAKAAVAAVAAVATADAPAKKAAKRTRKKATAPSAEPAQHPSGDTGDTGGSASADSADTAPGFSPPGLLFQAPEPTATPARRSRAAKAAAIDDTATEQDATERPAADEVGDDGSDEAGARRRRRGGRGRRGRGGRGAAGETGTDADAGAETAGESGEVDDLDSAEPVAETGDAGADDESDREAGTRRRRRRRRRGGGEDGEGGPDDPPNTVVRVREPRKTSRSRGADDGDSDGVRSVKGSTRLEAKKQRRREGREAGRRRPSIITEAEFLARRESVRRTMIVRQTGERTQIAVLEDDVLVEHYVSSVHSSGLVGNVYLGKVQNVLPSMEAAFVDVGKGRNAVLYAGEVNWDAAGMEGQPKRIEQALKSGDSVLVQVTKDPIGHKGARLTSQVSLAGRYLVYVPNGSMTGISRKLPDTERSRLKTILKKVVPEGAGVIVRTAAEGASEEELSRDVARLSAQWEDIEKKGAKASAPALLYSEPDLLIRVVRDIFNEDFAELVVAGDDAWDMLQPYVGHVAPDLADRLSRWTGEQDVFAANRIDEQITKALDRKVWLPSGGYLVIDRTEAMVVVDVNTGKFTGAGGNLEETVTKNNLEAAEELVRQLRLRDLGGMIVVDFIDMVLESNRDLVLRRLTECLGRDRTKHQVAEVTSLGLVQMTRKRVGQGLYEAFSETCECCNGRGVHIRSEPVEPRAGGAPERKGGRGRAKNGSKEAKEPVEPVEPAAAEKSPVAAEDPVEPTAEAEPARPRRRRRATG